MMITIGSDTYKIIKHKRYINIAQYGNLTVYSQIKVRSKRMHLAKFIHVKKLYQKQIFLFMFNKIKKVM